MSKLKKIPKFKTEDEEREFWSRSDSTEYIDWKQSKARTFSKLKPSTKTISLRLPESLLNELKLLANKRDVPYQSLIKIFLKERIDQEIYPQRKENKTYQYLTRALIRPGGLAISGMSSCPLAAKLLGRLISPLFPSA